MKTVKLHGVTNGGCKARTANQVVYFTNDKNSISISIDRQFGVLKTAQGYYKLQRDNFGRYIGNANGHRVQIILKKIVGEISWT